MKQEWQDFLQRQAASLHEGIVQHFGNAQDELTATLADTVLCDLGQFGLLKVSGEDAQSFLQNLFSSDVREVGAQRAQISSFNTAKGRILATFLIWKPGDDYFLHLPRSLCAAIQKKLSMYVLRSKVKITDASDEMVCLGVAGKASGALIEECFASIPQDAMAVTQHNHGTVIRLGSERFQIVTTPQHASALWKCLGDGVRHVGSSCWDWLNIRAGIPIVLPATQEQFVPQMANLELIGGVNFKKGCYPGQEIVARVQYLGKAKRRMYLAHIAGNAQAGDELFSAEMEAGQSCGMVVNAASAPGGGCDLLAVVQISSHAMQTVHLGSLQGEALGFLSLPYAIPA
ncbi:MAG: folate-binding protein YgfZ [Nitrosomonadales bacterium]|nr:folate-binding protein YgfZ [Nitrosomonadales bacterium]